MPSGRLQDLSHRGQRFGMLVALEPGRRPDGMAGWLCQCLCGNQKVVLTASLTSGATKSCGCNQGKQHGHTDRRSRNNGSPTYVTWKSMIQRCTNPRHGNYPRYGGKGVTVCDRWRTFVNFLDDMDERPEAHTLDRIDSAGNYEPGNCRWATKEQQYRNKRNSRLITIDGQSKTIGEWARQQDISTMAIMRRLYLGWSERDAVMVPAANTGRRRNRQPKPA